MIARMDSNTLPVDRGWAWAIAAAGFISHSLLISTVQVRTLLFVEILQMFNTTFTVGSLVFMFTSIAASFSSVLVTNYIMPKIKERGCLIVGGILSSMLAMGAAFAPNIGVFIAILSVKGIIAGLYYVPAMSLIPHYFKKYRSKASVIPFCGGSAANIIGPFIIKAVREEYGIRACYMILSAVELHYCVAGMLLRPVSSYRFRPDDAKTAVNDKSVVNGSVSPTSQDLLPDVAVKENPDQLLQVLSERLTEDVEAAQALLRQDFADAALHEKAVINTDGMTDMTPAVENRNQQAGADVVHTEIEEKPADKTTRWRTFYQASALDMWAYRCMLLAGVPGSVTIYLLNYMPTISKFQGASFDQAALLATIMGGVDLVSRISSGFIADIKVLPPSRLMLISLMALGIGCHFVRFATSFETLIVVIVYMGVFLGSRAPLQSLLIQDVVGPKKFPQAYSISIVVATLTSSMLNPALGAVIEATGSFVVVLHILGICCLLSGAILACLPLCVRLDVKHGRNK